MKSFLLLFISFLTFSSCQPYHKIEFIVEPLNSNLDGLHKELLERFKSTEFYNAEVEVDAAKNQIKVTADYDKSSKNGLARARAHFGSIKLDFWPAHRVTDPIITSLLDSLPEIDGFEYNQGAFYREVLGAGKNKDKLEEIKNQLNEAVTQNEEIEFLWGQKNEAEFGSDGDLFLLYMVNRKGKLKSDLNENNVVSSSVNLQSEYGEPEISIAFDKEGAEMFSELTRKAFMNGNRAIAIVVDDQVFSAPSVMGQIIGGRCSISGDLTSEDAINISHKLEFGSLTNPLKIISERIYKPE